MGRTLGRRIKKTLADAIEKAMELYRQSSRFSAPFKKILPIVAQELSRAASH